MIDGSQLQGIAAIIVALTGVGFIGYRGRRKQKAGVPASEDELDTDLISDRASLLEENHALRVEIDELDKKRRRQLEQAEDKRRIQLEAAENRRTSEGRIYSAKIDELVRERNEMADVSNRNRRIYIEHYGEDTLGLFAKQPPIDATWTPEELRKFRDLANADTT